MYCRLTTKHLEQISAAPLTAVPVHVLLGDMQSLMLWLLLKQCFLAKKIIQN